jgi:hypothetical protein
MEVGQDPNWGCRAKEKKIVLTAVSLKQKRKEKKVNLSL